MTPRNFIVLFVAVAFTFAARAAGAADSAASKAQNSPEGKKIVALVNDAVKLVEQKGKDAFPELRKDKKWNNGDTYIFIDRYDGVVLVLPPTPETEGKNLIDFQDAKGKKLVRELIQVAKSKGSGWVEYYWPKPGAQKESKKLSYVKKAKLPTGENVVVGSGIYVD
ncbi:MAG TPA: cache domain-containing protein [Candidatus Binatia bacterium]|nr:cache domain-containing protein [Candidatus Binatia bacterium]